MRGMPDSAGGPEGQAKAALIEAGGARHADFQEQIHQVQKMEAIGQLSAGIAHHFNNMLMGILPNVKLAAGSAPPELAPLLRDAEQAAVRAAEMVKQLSAFAGPGRPGPSRHEDLAEIAEHTLALCRAAFPPGITIASHRDERTPAVLVEWNKLEQALLNVLRNARDAIVEAAVPAPRITIAVVRVPAGSDELAGQRGASAVDPACVRISDNGVGIAAETLPRIYEPFFTTKPEGQGTGLGLATTWAIVRQQGGFIRCTSAPGRGTTFSIYLPGAPSPPPLD